MRERKDTEGWRGLSSHDLAINGRAGGLDIDNLGICPTGGERERERERERESS